MANRPSFPGLAVLKALAVAGLLPLTGSAQVTVGPGRDHATVAAALAAAAPHDTVRVDAGIYREGTLTLDRPVTLVGLPGAVLDGGGEAGLLFITADSVTVQGFTLRNTGISYTDDRAAIQVEKARFCRIRENVLDDAFFGIYLANAGDCLIQGNLLTAYGDRETRSGNGIHLWYSCLLYTSDAADE